MNEIKPTRRRFVTIEKLPAPALVDRQMAATAIAFRALGSVDAARRYLNAFDEPLNGRPLDVAGESSEGALSDQRGSGSRALLAAADAAQIESQAA